MTEMIRYAGECVVITQDSVHLGTITVAACEDGRVRLVAEPAAGVQVRRGETAGEIPATDGNPFGRPDLTTGDIAGLLRVAPRTVSQWIDNGRLKGWRLPGSLDRRALWSEVVAFAHRAGIPLAELLAAYTPPPARKRLSGLADADVMDTVPEQRQTPGGQVAVA